MNIYIIGAVVLFIILFALYIAFKSTPTPASTLLVEGPFSLSTQTAVIKTDSFLVPTASLNFLKNGTGTFQAYIYLDSLSQTGNLSSCGVLPNQPSCTSGLYDPCVCTNLIDCTNCSHDGYKKLISMYGVYILEVLPFPDASRQNTVSSQLSIQTQTANETFIETIPLPPIPLQKWVMFTLSKVGRRIDVYYNSSLVSSSTLLNMISTLQPSGSIVQAGSHGLSGKIGQLSMNDSVATIGSVATQYSQTSDTRGAPVKFAASLNSYTNTITPVNPNGLLKSLCLDGSCLHLPRVGNAHPSLSQFTDSLGGLSNTSRISTVSPAFSVQTQYR